MMTSKWADNTHIVRTNITAHRFNVNYSKIKDMNVGECVTSPIFKSAGYQWAIDVYPKGRLTNGNEGDYASLFLKLIEDHMGLDVSFTLGIIEGDVTQEANVLLMKFIHIFKNSEREWGDSCFVKTSTLEEQYAINGVFELLCSISLEHKVTKKMPVENSYGEMADVKFEVGGEIVPAHRLILAARSPVFKEELFGSMSETRIDCIKIKDVESKVFKALIHFIYTYSLPDNADNDMIQQLLVAAERYAIKELSMRCEERLIEKISIRTVLDFLIWAELHNLKQLKDSCIEMIAQRKSLYKLAVTEEYCVMMMEFPSLKVALRERINHP